MSGSARVRHMAEFMRSMYPSFSRRATQACILSSALEKIEQGAQDAKGIARAALEQANPFDWKGRTAEREAYDRSMRGFFNADGSPHAEPNDIELPGMWETADFMGGQEEVRGAASEAVSGSAIPNDGSQTAHPTSQERDDLQTALPEDTRDASGVPPGEWGGLTPKQAWWAGYRVGKGLPPDMPRSEAVRASPNHQGE